MGLLRSSVWWMMTGDRLGERKGAMSAPAIPTSIEPRTTFADDAKRARGSPRERPPQTVPAPGGIDLAVIDAVEGRLGLCVSGGSDSTALAVLLSESRPGRFVILTVDHGLREGSAHEVALVRALGDRLGVCVEAMAVDGRPSGSIQAWARERRLELFADAGRRLGLAAIVTGHTLEDQAETLLLRLARGSGLKGLAAMRPVSRHGDLTILRPLLGVSREALREALRQREQAWVEDPSNADLRFDRVAMRRLMPQLSAVGITAERLAQTATHLGRASDAIQEATERLLSTTREDRAGALILPRAPWREAAREVRLRALAAAVQRVGAPERPARFEAILNAERALLHDTHTTLQRVVVAPHPLGLVMWREARNIMPLSLAPGESGVFDGRYHVDLSRSAPSVTIAPVAGARLAALEDVWRPAVATAPGVYVQGLLVAVPTLGLRLRKFPRGAIKFTRLA